MIKKRPTDCDLIIFGGSGDLSRRKLIPALYYLFSDGRLPQNTRIYIAARKPFDQQAFLHFLKDSCKDNLPKNDFNEADWQRFSEINRYIQLSSDEPQSYRNLEAALDSSQPRDRVFYLAVPPALFGPVCKYLDSSGLTGPASRVVLEKPLGNDFESANRINERVAGSFEEQQIYRIDHYLGKEAVQNLLALRFANSIFEPLWCASHIEHVEITVAEKVGVTGRGGYYDRSGAMRDMVQSHLLQLLALVAMEPPADLEAESVRNEKLKVLRSLKPITAQQVECDTVRGQYSAGVIDGEEVIGYLQEDGIPADSTTESFVAIRAFVDNWRWAGVPFFLRSGKRLPKQQSQIVVRFKSVPHMIFEQHGDGTGYNSLVITLQPDEGIKLYLTAKIPGKGMNLRKVALDLDFSNVFQRRSWSAYERLLLDVIRCDSTLFVRRDEIEAAWRWVDPIIEGWKSVDQPIRSYAAGTWGPDRAKEIIEELGFCWDD